MSRAQQLKAIPIDFSRIGQLQAIDQVGVTRIPSDIWDVTTVCLPLSNKQFDAQFGGQINFFNIDTPVGECPGRFTSASLVANLGAPFLMCGICVVAVGEGVGFSKSGVVVDCPADATATPQVVGACGTGCDLGAIAQPGQTPAVFEFGSPTWRFIEALFRAYNFQFIINRRWQLLDLPLSDIGMCQMAPHFEGAGCSQVSAMPFIREANDSALNNDLNCQFLPVNTIVTTGADGVPASICAPPPQAGATFGHTNFMGRAPNMFRFVQPIPVLPFTSLGISFVPFANNNAFFEQMRAAATTGKEDCTATNPSSCFTGAAVNDGCGPGVITFPGGKITIGIKAFGYELAPAACLEAIYRFACACPTGAEFLAGNPYLGGLVQKMDNKTDPDRFRMLAGIAGASARD